MVSEGDQFDAAVAIAKAVLILVLVEDGLGVLKVIDKKQKGLSLNPCFSGGWSRSAEW